MNPAPPTIADWRAKVDKELAGASFDKVLGHTTAEGIAVAPLYSEAPALRVPTAEDSRVHVCVAWDGQDLAVLDDELRGGADSIWLAGAHVGESLLARPDVGGTFLVIDGEPVAAPRSRFAVGVDPIGALAAGHGDADASGLEAVVARYPRHRSVLVSTVPYHDAGADAADELAFALSTGAAYLRALVAAGVALETAADAMWLRLPVGRDTFGELCKLRALRVCWSKLVTAAGAPAATPLVHAVASGRTQAIRDPWVNMLRVTTQMFSAILGGAELITPASFDAALGPASALGRRVARNTALVLRDESQLGRVVDPAAGSYYLDSFTDALAREAWKRFRALEAAGGIVAALRDGSLRRGLDAAWAKRRAQLAKRKEPLLGVSEFANLDEERLPRPSRPSDRSGTALPIHRDTEDFETLRDGADALDARGPAISLVALGPAAEHRARVGFAVGFFASAGLRAKIEAPASATVCLCGSDERYAAEAADAARELKAAGHARVLLAGRPGALEASLREAGVDDFLFLGCDAVSVLGAVLAAGATR